MSRGAGHRCRSDPELLWLWCRLAATASPGPLAWEPPYAVDVALKRQKKKKEKKKRKCISRAQKNLSRVELKTTERVRNLHLKRVIAKEFPGGSVG